MDAQRIHRTFRHMRLTLPPHTTCRPKEALLALARAASQCPPNLAPFEIARHVRAQTERWIVESKHSGRRLRETG
jgi:hypothetical protein